MFFWNSLAFSMIQWMLAIWSLVPLPILNLGELGGGAAHFQVVEMATLLNKAGSNLFAVTCLVLLPRVKRAACSLRVCFQVRLRVCCRERRFPQTSPCGFWRSCQLRSLVSSNCPHHTVREAGQCFTMLSCLCLPAQSCPTLCDPVDCSPPGSSVHGISQARTLEWVAISFSRASSLTRDRTWVYGVAW